MQIFHGIAHLPLWNLDLTADLTLNFSHRRWLDSSLFATKEAVEGIKKLNLLVFTDIEILSCSKQETI